LVGTIVEACNDERGMKWPKHVAPFPVHLVSLSAKDPVEAEKVMTAASALHDELTKAGFEPLWDERSASAGEKFADADLIGLPLRIVISSKTLAEGAVEWKPRHEAEAKLMPLADTVAAVETFMNESYETTSH
jgi:prolyl-tRNA synthetase